MFREKAILLSFSKKHLQITAQLWLEGTSGFQLVQRLCSEQDRGEQVAGAPSRQVGLHDLPGQPVLVHKHPRNVTDTVCNGDLLPVSIFYLCLGPTKKILKVGTCYSLSISRTTNQIVIIKSITDWYFQAICP